MRPDVARNVSEANHTAKEESDQGTIRCCFTKLRLWLRCLLLMVSAYLTVYCNLAFCRDGPIADIAVSTQRARKPTNPWYSYQRRAYASVARAEC